MPDVTWPQVVLIVALAFGFLFFLGYVLTHPPTITRYREPIRPPQTPKWESTSYYRLPPDMEEPPEK